MDDPQDCQLLLPGALFRKRVGDYVRKAGNHPLVGPAYPTLATRRHERQLLDRLFNPLRDLLRSAHVVGCDVLENLAEVRKRAL